MRKTQRNCRINSALHVLSGLVVLLSDIQQFVLCKSHDYNKLKRKIFNFQHRYFKIRIITRILAP
jgi:hypothetical protein